MKANVTVKNVNSESCRLTIMRNLNRILDIKIIDIDLKNGILHFLCNGQEAFEQVRRELNRIGFPVQNYKYEPPCTGRNVDQSRSLEMV